MKMTSRSDMSMDPSCSASAGRSAPIERLARRALEHLGGGDVGFRRHVDRFDNLRVSDSQELMPALGSFGWLTLGFLFLPRSIVCHWFPVDRRLNHHRMYTQARLAARERGSEMFVVLFRMMKFGAPDTIRTCGLHLRRVALYPAELRAHLCGAYAVLTRRSCETDVIDTDFASPCFPTLF
jgi:hypothetical protein